ncbi:MAG: response regulator transcription factor [Planctomycetaceae bacterium]|nr:response regulator transcription factor [Planctomycetaceae bacterium]
MQTLVIEDDEVIGKSLKKGLEEAGHVCIWAKDGRSGQELAFDSRLDVIVLDLMLPDVSGITILKQLRDRGVRTPVLILTALGTVDERVAGLEAGADDYLVKPFSFPELQARLTAITRRSRQAPTHVLQVGPLDLDLSTRRVTRESQEIDLTPTEFSLLEFMMRHAGQVVTRKMLCEHLWEADWEGVTNVVEVHVSRLRGKIDKDFGTPLMQTIRGRGYMLKAE